MSYSEWLFDPVDRYQQIVGVAAFVLGDQFASVDRDILTFLTAVAVQMFQDGDVSGYRYQVIRTAINSFTPDQTYANMSSLKGIPLFTDKELEI